jgi:hypothetical protein
MQAKHVTQTIKKLRISFGLIYDHPDDDIMHLIGRLRYMKRLAESRERAEAAAESDKPLG